MKITNASIDLILLANKQWKKKSTIAKKEKFHLLDMVSSLRMVLR